MTIILKKAFIDDLRNNGYRVINVLNQDDINIIKNASQWDKLKYNEEIREYTLQCL